MAHGVMPGCSMPSNDPKYERHAELTEWIGVDFDPDAFDPEWLTADVASLAKKWSRKPTAKRARRA